MVERLLRAVNSHDADAVADCFAEDYRAETPAHPERDFVGREHVRRNWSGLLAAVPDVTAAVTRLVESDGAPDGGSDGAAAGEAVVWAEREQTGTPHGGGTHLVRGVVILGVADQRARWVRFYLEPVSSAPRPAADDR